MFKTDVTIQFLVQRNSPIHVVIDTLTSWRQCDMSCITVGHNGCVKSVLKLKAFSKHCQLKL